MLVQVRDALGRPASYEDFLDRTRDVARQSTFLTGARMLSGVFSAERAGQAYSAVAQAIVQTSFEAVEREFVADYGRVPGGRIAILGLGRLGTREMTATSDLDLVVLYDFDHENRDSDGARAVDATVYYTRLTQRLVSALTAPTRRGALYEDSTCGCAPRGARDRSRRSSAASSPISARDAELWEHHGAHPRPRRRRRRRRSPTTRRARSRRWWGSRATPPSSPARCSPCAASSRRRRARATRGT